ncbi:MAG: hypothetical protein AB7K09_15650 [Planctomycetota bacterium]
MINVLANWWDRSPAAAAAVLISCTMGAMILAGVVAVSALQQPQVAGAIAERLATNTREMGEQVGRLEQSVQLLQVAIVREDQERTKVMADLVVQVGRLVEQVDALTARVGRLEKNPEDGGGEH